MKKILIILFGISLLSVLMSSCSTKNINVEIGKACSPIDNGYNNYRSGGGFLCMKNDKLIYNSFIECTDYGYYELKDGQARRIYWKGPIIIPATTTSGFYYHGGELYLTASYSIDNLEVYSTDRKRCIDTKLELSGGYQFSNDYIYFTKWYWEKNASNHKNALYRVDKSKIYSDDVNDHAEMLLDEIDEFVVFNNTLIFSKKISYDKYGLFLMSLDNRKVSEVEWNGKQFYSFHIVDRGVVFDTDFELYLWDKDSKTVELILESDTDQFRLNAYQNQLYFYSDITGLISCDLSTKEVKTIVKHNDIENFVKGFDRVRGINIVDDRFIYLDVALDFDKIEHGFISSDLWDARVLIRTDIRGNLERVFPVDRPKMKE